MTYEYECSNCKHNWEEDQKITDDPVKICKKCNNETAKRLISCKSFILYGKWFKSGGY